MSLVANHLLLFTVALVFCKAQEVEDALEGMKLLKMFVNISSGDIMAIR